MSGQEDFVLVPRDDETRPFADSLLPLAVIKAGEDVIDRADLDMRNYVSGKTIDWDSGMIAVAVYRAMTKAAAAPASPQPQGAGCMDEREACHKARDDARSFGTGYVRTFPDGRVEHIPPDQVTIFTRPNTQEA